MGSIMYRRWWLPYMGSLAPKSGVVGTPCHCVFGTFRVFPCMDLSSPRVAQGGYPYRSLRYLSTFIGSGVAGWGMKARAGKKKELRGCRGTQQYSLWLAIGSFHQRPEQSLLCIRTYGG